MPHHIETSREEYGEWVAKAAAVPGLVVYGGTEEEALLAAEKLTAILLPARRQSVRRILGFYPGRIPESAQFAMHPFAEAA